MAMAGIGMAQVLQQGVAVPQQPVVQQRVGVNQTAVESPHGVRYYSVAPQGAGGMAATAQAHGTGYNYVHVRRNPHTQVLTTAEDLRDLEDSAYEDGFDAGRRYERRRNAGYDYGASARARRTYEARGRFDGERRGADEARSFSKKRVPEAVVVGEFTANGKNAREIAVGRKIERCYIEVLSGSVIINTVIVRPEKKVLKQGVRLEEGAKHKIEIGEPREVSGFRISEDGRGTYRVIVE